MPAPLDQHSAYISLIILGLTFAAFVLERFPPTVVAIASAASFLLLGFIDTQDLLNVFSNSAPITIAAMFILSGALVRTGVLESSARWIGVYAMKRPRTMMVVFFFGVSIASAFINNTAVVAVLIPIMAKLARSLKMALTQLLIPLSYLAIVGGTCTLIGTSTNLLVDGVARNAGLPPFSIFTITPIGIVAVIAASFSLWLLAPRLLPVRHGNNSISEEDEQIPFLTEVVVTKDSTVEGKPLGSIRRLNHPGITILAIERNGMRRREGLMDHILAEGDVVIMLATMPEVLTLHTETDFKFSGTETASGSEREKLIVEAIQARPEGGALSKRISDLRLERFGVRLLGINRHGRIPGVNLRSARLRAADRLLLEGTRDGLAAAAEETNLINISQPRSRSFRRHKAPLALSAIFMVVALAALNVMAIEGLAFLAVAAILILRCIDADEAWQSLDANVLILIFSMLALGAGLEKTGAVQLIVSWLDPLLRNGSPVVVLVTIYFLAVIMTELITNNAVAVILTPIAIGLGNTLGYHAEPLVIAVMFGASSSFATPIGYQTNTMVYGAGNYRFSDFLKIGILTDIIVGISNCTMIYLLFPLAK